MVTEDLSLAKLDKQIAEQEEQSQCNREGCGDSMLVEQFYGHHVRCPRRAKMATNSGFYDQNPSLNPTCCNVIALLLD